MEPASVQEAMQKQKCIAAIQEEVHMIEKKSYMAAYRKAFKQKGHSSKMGFQDKTKC